MTLPNRPRYAARLNAFKVGLPGKPGLADLLGQAARVTGIDAGDLNYADHLEGLTPSQGAQVAAMIARKS